MDGSNYEYFSIVEAGAQSIIRFRASISGSTAAMDEVQQELIDFIGRNTCQKLIIDLSDTAYLPSSVIGILAVICSRGVELHLANASPDIVHVMEVMGLNRRIHINEFELPAETEKKAEAPASAPVAVIEGYVVACPSCNTPASVDKHALGSSPECDRCHKPIHIDLTLLESASQIYFDCPKCGQQLKISPDWIDATVACDFCGVSAVVRRIR